MTTVLAPAIRYAREGFPVSPGVARAWALAVDRYKGHRRFDAWQQTFAPAGRAPAPGERFASPDHARALERIAQTSGRDFYEGLIARAIDQESRRFGGALRLDDLAEHRPLWVEPLSVPVGAWHLHELPPNGQGLAALVALGILDRLGLHQHAVDTPTWLHLQIEATRIALRLAERCIADPDHLPTPVHELLDPQALTDLARSIDPARASPGPIGLLRTGGTVLLAAADAQGNMACFIQSNYTGFGSGLVVPGWGIALHNRGANFTLQPGHPNELAPAKRPYHTIIPAMASRQGIADLAFGVMGGFMQPQGHVQVFTRIALHGQNPQAALDAPRWQLLGDGRVMVEPGLERLGGPDVLDRLQAMGHRLVPTAFTSARFGRGQAIHRLDAGYLAASDHRADGQAVGF
ncbi:MAG: bifunctional cephalosporin acylase/gamma-glutamyltranspeptidase [Phycisphaerales bacterium]|nr:MAG: bifunctional cephalosporin acylase/gamma-glutamyltranspeptidase [Phycisphaerales bacterium]